MGKKNKSKQNTNNSDYSLIIAIASLVIVSCLIAIMAFKGNGAFETIKWLAVLLVIAIGLRPVLPLNNLELFDGGFSMSMGFGVLMCFIPAWVLSLTNLAAFASPVSIISVIVWVIIANILSCKNKLKYKWTTDSVRRLLVGAAVFLVVFTIAFYFRGFRPYLNNQTEQFMDFGFMEAMYHQKAAYFDDFWMAGEKVNYYYLGQAVAVFLCRASFVTPDFGYNLMLVTIFALLFMMVTTLTGAVLEAFNVRKNLVRICGSILAGIVTCCTANGHYLLYKFILPFVGKFTGNEVDDYWFPSCTNWIGIDPNLPDKGKTEFPSYGLVLGDLHAHVCNMMFTIPLLAILLNIAIGYAKSEGDTTGSLGAKDANVDENTAKDKSKDKILIENLLNIVKSKEIVFLGILLGMYKGINYWDFPIYFVISGAVILFCDYKKYGVSLKTTLTVLVKGAYVLILSTIVILPFTLTFEKMMSGIMICDSHTQVYKFLVIWGVPIVVSVLFLKQIFSEAEWKIKNLKYHHLYMIVMILCAIGLIFVPEIIYVRDIYEGEYDRYNTMFKLTFQAYIIFGICIGTAVGVFLDRGKEIKRYKVAAIITSVIVLVMGTYIFQAGNDYGLMGIDSSERLGMDAFEATKADSNVYSIWGAIEYLRGLDKEDVTILEAAGNSYTYDDIVSVFTGFPTVEGWYVHEELWRDDPPELWDIRLEVSDFYQNGDKEFCRDFVDRYGIDYIFYGPSEESYYALNYDGFSDFTEPVWYSDDGNYFLFEVSG